MYACTQRYIHVIPYVCSCAHVYVWRYLQVQQFIEQPRHKEKCVVVHCTHGFNRTGFMIAHFVMRMATRKGGPQCTVAQVGS